MERTQALESDVSPGLATCARDALMTLALADRGLLDLTHPDVEDAVSDVKSARCRAHSRP